MSEQPPRPLDWFKFYPKDFLSSASVCTMTTEEVGAYMLLLCHAWTDPMCSIPSDDASLARLTRTGKKWERVKVTVLTNFKPLDGNETRLVNPRLLSEWVKAESTRVDRKAYGKKGGEKKAENAKQEPSKSLAYAKQEPSKRVAIEEEEIEEEIEKEEYSLAGAREDGGQAPEPQTGFLPEPEPVLLFPTIGSKQWALTPAKFAGYKKTFPAVDVDGQLRLARQWAEDNPKKRKTAAGMPRFLSAWLSRAPTTDRVENGAMTNPDRPPNERLRPGWSWVFHYGSWQRWPDDVPCPPEELPAELFDLNDGPDVPELAKQKIPEAAQ